MFLWRADFAPVCGDSTQPSVHLPPSVSLGIKTKHLSPAACIRNIRQNLQMSPATYIRHIRQNLQMSLINSNLSLLHYSCSPFTSSVCHCLGKCKSSPQPKGGEF